MNNPNIPIGHSLKCLSSPTTVTTPTHSLVVTLSPSTSTPHSLPLAAFNPPYHYTHTPTPTTLPYTTYCKLHPLSTYFTLSHPTITPYNTLLHPLTLYSNYIHPPNPPPISSSPHPLSLPFFPSFPLSLFLLPRPVEFNLGKFKNLRRSYQSCTHQKIKKKRYLLIPLLTTKIWCPPQVPPHLSVLALSPSLALRNSTTTTQTFFFYFRFPLPSFPPPNIITTNQPQTKT